MTVTPLKIDKLAATALALLQREIVLPNTVTVKSGAEFAGALDDTITIRVPARTTARHRDLRPADENARTIVLSNLAEQAITITIDDNIYNAVGIEDEVATLDVRDFAEQVLSPQIRAIAVEFEDKIADLLESAPYVNTVEFDPDDPHGSLIDARQLLNLAGVPVDGRTLVVGSSIEAAILKSDQLNRYDSNGEGSAYRDASMGRIAGFNAISSLAVPHNEAYVYHKSAFAMAVLAPIVPRGASFGRSLTAAGGVPLTWLCDYDALVSRDRSIVHTYCGANYTADPADANAELDLVATGGLIRAVKLELDGS